MRTKILKSGAVWVGYYYNGRDEQGRRVEIPLGSDFHEALRRWAELESKPAPALAGLMEVIFRRYELEVLPQKAPRTQRDNLLCLKQLTAVFGKTHVDAITPAHIAKYRDLRGKAAPVRANREIALFSHVFNVAREWGYTSKENPTRGVRKNKELPRDYYADPQVWDAVYAQACQELRDAMDLSYLTGQRPGDVLAMAETDIRNGALEVKQGKTKKKLRILLDNPDGTRTSLGKLLDEIRARPGKVKCLRLIATPGGAPLNRWTLRIRFDSAREAAAEAAEKQGTPEMLDLSKRIRQFQFRDIRPKAASEIGDLGLASKLLGHTEQELTKKVYVRIGETVKPTK